MVSADSATGTISDNDPITFAINSTPSISEELEETATFTISVGGGELTGSNTASVNITASGATSGTDYDNFVTAINDAIALLGPTPGVSFTGTTLTFDKDFAGPDLVFKVDAINDEDVEAPEAITATLSGATVDEGTATITTPSATTDITELDADVTFAISSTPSISEAAADAATFTVTLGGDQLSAGNTASVIIVAVGSATSGSDYDDFVAAITAAAAVTAGVTYIPASMFVPAVLTFDSAFATGSTFSFTVNALDDSLGEGTETITASLFGGVVDHGSATITTATTDTTIIDDDLYASDDEYTATDLGVKGNLITRDDGDGDVDDDPTFVVGTATAGATIIYDAALDTNNDNILDDQEGTATNLTFTDVTGAITPTTPITPQAVSSSFVGITSAFSFSGAGPGDEGTYAVGDSLDGLGVTGNDASFEVWFKADTLTTGTDAAILYETGGSGDGMSIALQGSTVLFTATNNDAGDPAVSVQASFDLSTLGIDPTAEFVQVVGTIDINNEIQLYVNGTLVDTVAASIIPDWAGGDGATLGGAVGSNLDIGALGANPVNFVGDIARFAFYESDLTDSEVLTNFTAVAGWAVTAVDGSPVSIVNPIDVGNGTVMIAADGSFTFTPDAGFVGTETFEYTLTDSSGDTDTATATFTVSGATAVTSATEEEGDALVHTVTLSDADGGVFGFNIADNTATIADNDYSATPVFSDGVTYNAVTGTITVPSGVTSFTVTVTSNEDVTEELDEAYNITVGGVTALGLIENDDGLIAEDDEYSLDENTSIKGNIISRDDGDGLVDRDSSANVGPITAGAALDFRSGVDIVTGDWQNSLGDGQWEIPAVATAVSSFIGINGLSVASFDGAGLTAGVGAATYDVNTGTSDQSLAQQLDDGSDATFELWFKAADAAGNEVLFETGGTDDGVSMRLNGTVVEYYVQANGELTLTSFDLSTLGIDPSNEFVQIVGTLDGNGTNIVLYVNGSRVDTATHADVIDDWSSNNDAGMGSTDSTIAGGGSAGAFTGEIAIFRVYESELTSAQVTDNFAAVAGLAVTQVNGVDLPVDAATNGIALANGTLMIAADGSYMYTPDADYEGLETFTYTLVDANGNLDTATVTITVDKVNVAPVAFDDAVTIADNAVFSGNVPVATDEDGNLDPNGYVLAVGLPGAGVVDNMDGTYSSTNANGTLLFSSDGSYTFTPTDVTGADITVTFDYQATDTSGVPLTESSADQTVSITVTDVGTAAIPVVAGVDDITYLEGSGEQNLFDGDISITDSDSTVVDRVVVELTNYNPATDTLDYITAGTGITGVVTDVGGVWTLTLTGGSLTDEPYNGYETVLQTITFENNEADIDITTRTLTVTAYDETATAVGGIDSAIFTVTPINTPPEAVDLTVGVVENGTILDFGFGQLPFDIDDNTSDLTIVIDSLPTDGVVKTSLGISLFVGIELTVAQFDALQYETAPGVTGQFTLGYTVFDDDLAFDTGTITIGVGDALDDTATVYESEILGGSGQDAGIGVSAEATGNLFANDGMSGNITQVVYNLVTFNPGDGTNPDTGIGATGTQIIIDTTTDAGGLGNGYITIDTTTGAYTYTLTQNADNSAPGGLTDLQVEETFTYTRDDGAGTLDTANLDIVIIDDKPKVVDVVENVPASTEGVFNLVVALDISTSMNADVIDPDTGLSIGTRLTLAQEALIALVNGYFNESTQVTVTLTVFADGAHTIGEFVTKESFKDAIDLIQDANGDLPGGGTGTDYVNDNATDNTSGDLIDGATAVDDGNATINNSTSYYDGAWRLQFELEEDLAAQQLAGDTETQNISYFLSDGSVTADQGEYNNFQWETFVAANAIDSFSVGLGTGLPADKTDLNRIHNIDSLGAGNGAVDPALIVEDVADLTAALISTIPTGFGGQVVSSTDGNIDSVVGADGGYVQTITLDIDGAGLIRTYTYDPMGTITAYNGTPDAPLGVVVIPIENITGTTLTLDNSIGFEYGKLNFDFSDGSYRYFAGGTAGEVGAQVVIDFSVLDAEGDEAITLDGDSTLTLNIVESVPEANDDVDTVSSTEAAIGNVITGLGTDGGIALGNNFTNFAVQAGGVDSAVDNAKITQITIGDATFDMTDGTITGANSQGLAAAHSADSSGSDPALINELTITGFADGATLIFQGNGYYEYVPPLAVFDTNLRTAANATAAGLTITANDGNGPGTVVYTNSATEGGIGVDGGGINDRLDFDGDGGKEALIITFDTGSGGVAEFGANSIVFDLTSYVTGESILVDVYDYNGVALAIDLVFDAATIDLSAYQNVGRIEVQAGSDGSNIGLGNTNRATYVRIDEFAYIAASDPASPSVFVPLVVEYVLASASAEDTAVLTINRVDSIIVGTAFDDNDIINPSLVGTANNDSISGKAGDDIIRGLAGFDVLAGGDDADEIYGGDDDDRISGNAGDDELYGDAGDDFLEGNDGVDILDGGAGDDELRGGDGDDELYGLGDNDVLFGDEGDDELYGQAGLDILFGGSGNDMLFGGTEDDTLTGGAGDDMLSGGLGSDTFVWELADQGTLASPAIDTITDVFVTGASGDVLDLSDLLIGEESTALENYLHFELDGADTVIHIDQGGNVDTQETQQIVLTGVDLVTGFADDAAIIASLTPNNLIVDT
jgi:hypothetical protein